MLQEAGLWRYAATLAALQLSGDEKAAALERWAAHIHQARPHRISEIQSGDTYMQISVLSRACGRQACHECILLR